MEQENLRKLEESLWIPATRFDRSYMDEILSTDFFEFGRSGRIYNRHEIMSAKSEDINVKLPLENFEIHEISKDVVLVTYMSKVQYDELEVANRSSLWVNTDDGWKIKFHQGTPC